uniref:C2H2-type domain-containing protein n=1 Tax=Amphilophus citrinellus TaxID=61819 RepID=A0A3Q0SLB0_AMPCI
FTSRLRGFKKYCEKCGFASTDAAVFEKHMVEHMGTRFYCFYCNDVSYSEAELNAHLKRHTSKYPFKCPHCGQGYMRRLCLVKHIDRLHSKSIIQGPAKSGVTKNLQGPVSSALTGLHAADPSLLRPVVRVTIPNTSAAAVRLGKDEQRAKTLETNASNVTNGNPERLSPLNGLIQHNRALTVSLPEEVTIPAGCLVELVEVKTVNGTKELKLRLVSQQENESMIKDARTTASQNTALGKPLSSTLINHTNTVRPITMGMSMINRKPCDAKMGNMESNVVAKERAVSEPESFPVISSVFSLSQQPEDAQGPIQPLVMALRGIVMDKSSSSVSTTQDEVKITNTEHMDKPPILGQSAQVATKNGSFIHESLLREQTCEPVKAEDYHQGVDHPPTLTHNHIHVKEETKITLPTDKCSHSPDSKSLTLEESKVTEPAETSESQEPLEQMAKSEQDAKFLTVTLKRVQVGVWKQTKKGLKLRISKYKTQVPVGSVTDCTVIYPMPLKVDQPVKRPGPNQPVVVLNHPKLLLIAGAVVVHSATLCKILSMGHVLEPCCT